MREPNKDYWNIKICHEALKDIKEKTEKLCHASKEILTTEILNKLRNS